jgi:hypothetical protein
MAWPKRAVDRALDRGPPGAACVSARSSGRGRIAPRRGTARPTQFGPCGPPRSVRRTPGPSACRTTRCQPNQESGLALLRDVCGCRGGASRQRHPASFIDDDQGLGLGSSERESDPLCRGPRRVVVGASPSAAARRHWASSAIDVGSVVGSCPPRAHCAQPPETEAGRSTRDQHHVYAGWNWANKILGLGVDRRVSDQMNIVDHQHHGRRRACSPVPAGSRHRSPPQVTVSDATRQTRRVAPPLPLPAPADSRTAAAHHPRRPPTARPPPRRRGLPTLPLPLSCPNRSMHAPTLLAPTHPRSGPPQVRSTQALDRRAEDRNRELDGRDIQTFDGLKDARRLL